jgi:predicted AAA+ superfamily ATPase
VERFYLESASRLSDQIERAKPDWVVIDEVQKNPALLDQVHHEIEKRGVKFALTGSSARKLKRGGANLLAGRAFINYLYPLTHKELSTDFELMEVLKWGSLPEVFHFDTDLEKEEYLKSYVNTYLKEEVFQEQLVRSTHAFQKFLPIAAQMNGCILNLSSIAKDLGVDWTTVRTYYDILEDTLLGFRLPALAKSLRKQQLKSAKFYLFDTGVYRALQRTLKLEVDTGQKMGLLFEQFMILEMHRLNNYNRKDFKMSYLATQGGLEVDVVVERPGMPMALVEIKSTDSVKDTHLKHLKAIKGEYPNCDFVCLSREKTPRQVDGIEVLPWQMGLEHLGFCG